MVLVGEREQAVGRAYSIYRVTQGGQVRWRWTVGGPNGSENGEERNRKSAQVKAEKAKRRCL